MSKIKNECYSIILSSKTKNNEYIQDFDNKAYTNIY